MTLHPHKPARLLVVCPSWLGDVVMATPALRVLRRDLAGSFIGGLVRPGIDELLAGSDFFDELHVDRARGVMGPKAVAAKLRPRRYDAALLLTNSFSTALITRLAFIPRRVGYERDGRGLLLTDRLQPPRRARPHRGWAPVSAVEYYQRAARVLLGAPAGDVSAGDPSPRLELGVTPEQAQAALELLQRATVLGDDGTIEAFVVLNPGGNNPAKRWPAERFARLAAHMVRAHGVRVLVNGSPGERELCAAVVERARQELDESVRMSVQNLSTLGVTIGSLKGVVRAARLMVTNDTGPRHVAAAFGVPTIALFGPTDPRWTTLPDSAIWSTHTAHEGSGVTDDVGEGNGVRRGVVRWAREIMLAADPSLPTNEVADDHPERCRIDRIEYETVRETLDRVLARGIPTGAAALPETS